MKRISVAFGLSLVVSIFAAAPCLAETAATPATTPAAAPAAAPAAPEKAEKPAAKKADKKAEKKTGTYLGEVVEIDREADKIFVAPKNSEIAMVLNTSKVKKGLDELKVGDWVEATFEAKVGTLYALTVTKAKKPAEKKKSDSKPKMQKPANHP